MATIEPFRSWLPLDERARAERDPRISTLLTAVRDHMEHEIRGDLARLMETLTAEPVYHLWNTSGAFTLTGRAAVTGFYQNLIALGANQFEVVIDKIVGDHGNVITEGQVKQVQRGEALLGAGRSEVGGRPVKPGDLFLTRAQLITVWPADPDGRLIGEDIYYGENPLARAVPITRADLPEGYRLP